MCVCVCMYNDKIEENRLRILSAFRYTSDNGAVTVKMIFPTNNVHRNDLREEIKRVRDMSNLYFSFWVIGIHLEFL